MLFQHGDAEPRPRQEKPGHHSRRATAHDHTALRCFHLLPSAGFERPEASGGKARFRGVVLFVLEVLRVRLSPTRRLCHVSSVITEIARARSNGSRSMPPGSD